MSKLTVVTMVMVGLCLMLGTVSAQYNLQVFIKNLSDEDAHCSVQLIEANPAFKTVMGYITKSFGQNPSGDSLVQCYYDDRWRLNEDTKVPKQGKYCFTIENQKAPLYPVLTQKDFSECRS